MVPMVGRRDVRRCGVAACVTAVTDRGRDLPRMPASAVQRAVWEPFALSYAIRYEAPDDPDWAGLVVVDDEAAFAAEKLRVEASGYVVSDVSRLPSADIAPRGAGAG